MRNICVFFGFKQKTAYEMRIRDWSSDVCSSDLAENAGLLDSDSAAAPDRRGSRSDSHRPRDADRICVDRRAGRHHTRAREAALRQIGRASCRVRAVPYLSILVVAVSLQNNRTRLTNPARSPQLY